MSRIPRIVLAVSVALNLGFATAWALQHSGWLDAHRSPVARQDPSGTRGRSGGGWSQGQEGWSRGPGREAGRWERGDWARSRARWLGTNLHLEADRRDALRDSLRSLEPQLMEARRALREARRAFRDEMMKPEVDRQQVFRCSAEVSRCQARLDSLITEALVRESKVLRPEERHGPGPWFPHPRHRTMPR